MCLSVLVHSLLLNREINYKAVFLFSHLYIKNAKVKLIGRIQIVSSMEREDHPPRRMVESRTLYVRA